MNHKHNHRDIIETGYYSPSNANWSYHIFMIIDETGARLYRTTFGNEEEAIKTHNMESLYAGKGSSTEYRWKDIKDLHNIKDYKGRNWGENNGMKD